MVDTKDFSTILSGLLNDFPAIGAREIRFGELGDKSGVGIYPSAAATVISETTDIMRRLPKMQLCGSGGISRRTAVGN